METAARPRPRSAPVAELQRIFDARLEAVVAYGGRAPVWSHGMALVSTLTMDDLVGLAAAVPGWHARGLAILRAVTR